MTIAFALCTIYGPAVQKHSSKFRIKRTSGDTHIAARRIGLKKVPLCGTFWSRGSMESSLPPSHAVVVLKQELQALLKEKAF
jgi:hypothetical protein